jgi:hypothetical protein
LNFKINREIKYIPKYEKNPPIKTYITNGTKPICETLYGRLNIPVPIALAKSAKMDPLIAPGPNGEKVLWKKVLFDF